MARNDHGVLNTHFRPFANPLGIVADHSRFSIGGTNTVWEYRHVPAVTRTLEPPDAHEACEGPRRLHVTADIDVQELASDTHDTLWLIHTGFRCLWTLDAEHSLTPRWRPPLVTALAPEDRGPLNGLGMVNGRPRYITA